MIPDWSFGDRLRKARRDIADLSQQEMADRLDVTQRALASWESGRTAPRDMQFIADKVEALTGVSAAWIAGVA